MATKFTFKRILQMQLITPSIYELSLMTEKERIERIKKYFKDLKDIYDY